MNGTVEGWLAYDWIPMDKYLQLCACNINHGMEQALTELLERLEKRFPGYTMYFGFPEENLDAAGFLQAKGFRRIEDDWNYSFFFEGYKLLPENQNIERITRDNFDAFRAVYHADPETYWNCDRILGAIDDWIIFVYYDNGRPAATVFLQGNHGYYEIYGMEFAGGVWKEDIFRGLLTAALNACKGLGAKYMTYFCGERETRILPEFGFQCIGRYSLYCKTLCGE